MMGDSHIGSAWYPINLVRTVSSHSTPKMHASLLVLDQELANAQNRIQLHETKHKASDLSQKCKN